MGPGRGIGRLWLLRVLPHDRSIWMCRVSGPRQLCAPRNRNDGRMELLSGLLSSLGLSGAAGLNAYIPLLLVGLLGRFGIMDLAQPFDLLSNTWVLVGVGVIGLLDFVGDKIVWTYTSQGAALALPGAIPGLGTIVQASTEIGMATADIALMIPGLSS